MGPLRLAPLVLRRAPGGPGAGDRRHLAYRAGPARHPRNPHAARRLRQGRGQRGRVPRALGRVEGNPPLVGSAPRVLSGAICVWVARPPARYAAVASRGVWRSLVARFVRDEEVVGSNPATPTAKSLATGLRSVVRQFAQA